MEDIMSRVDAINEIAGKFIQTTVNEDGVLNGISFHNDDQFNFAYDVVDAIAEKKPDKLAMLHVSLEKEERYFSFGDMSRYASKTANYFKGLGIKKGDRVMLVLKRHYQFWFSILGLHKIGAVMIPTPNILVEKDYSYRFEAAGVRAIVCTGDGHCAKEVEKALAARPVDLIKIMARGEREGWENFDEGVRQASDVFEKPEGADYPCGDDPMLMFFTSGTTGYPKIAMHNFRYPLGHYITAKYWHQVDPEGIHFTIADTGWGKALWGKIYGQWLCEAAVFTYDFDLFSAGEVLPMFEKYKITTFCAPPTTYRLLIKENLSKYDFSSIQVATTAGEALNPEVYERFYEATGLRMMEGFGQTETTLLIGNLANTTPKAGSMGKASPLYQLEILRPDGTKAEPMETGEVAVCVADGVPDGLFTGYYMDEEMTGEVWHDGYYFTRDTAYRDEEGYIYFVGRIDDVIKTSGYRVGPFEVESVIMELPFVLECAVIPVPDKVRGQAIKALIVPVAGTEVTPQLKKTVMRYVRENSAHYKAPRVVEFVESLPKTISGKIRHAELRKREKAKRE